MILLFGCRAHTLQNIDIAIPKNAIVGFTGRSGSGKSSLAYDCLFRACHKEFCGLFAAQDAAMKQLHAPTLASASGLMPAVATRQLLFANPSLTLSSITRCSRFIRALVFERGIQHSPKTNAPLTIHTALSAAQAILCAFPEKELLELTSSPLPRSSLDFCIKSGFHRAKVGDTIYDLSEQELPSHVTSFSLIIDRLSAKKENSDRLIESCTTAMDIGSGLFFVNNTPYSNRYYCPQGKLFFDDSWLLFRRYKNMSVADIEALPIAELIIFIPELEETLKPLLDLGLGKLKLNTPFGSLSTGERQRALLGRYLKSNLGGLLYIFDEPSRGLSGKELDLFCKKLHELRAKGNTIVIIEHDTRLLKTCDTVFELNAGRLVPYTPGLPSPPILSKPLSTLKNTAQKKLVALIGPSGSGKTQFLRSFPFQTHFFHESELKSARVSSFFAQEAGVFSLLRELFASTRLSQARGLTASYFSLNSPNGGRCRHCKGLGVEILTSELFENIESPCNACGGMRFCEEALQYTFKGLSIGKILSKTVGDALDFFSDLPVLAKSLAPFASFGLDLLSLQQPLNAMSGGERQRLLLISSMNTKAKRTADWELFDLPCAGLANSDIDVLIRLLRVRLETFSHRIVVAEHREHFLSQCDFVLEINK